jgi:hypothetical protein
LIVSQHGQSSCPPHQTCPRSPRGPPQAHWAPQAPGESTPVGALPHSVTLQSEPDSPRAAHLSRAARSQGGGRSSGHRLARPEHAIVGCGRHQGGQS